MTDAVVAEGDLIARKEGSAGILRLNRPKAINAVTLEMFHDIDKALDAFEADPGRLRGIALALGYGSANMPQRRKANSGEKLLREYRSKRESIRACYEHYFVSSQIGEIN